MLNWTSNFKRVHVGRVNTIRHLLLCKSYGVESSDGTSQGSIVESISDPISLKFKSGGTRATLGARLNLPFIKIFADYTLQEYNTATLGIAFSFR